jgi:hypothetical protein
MPFAPMRVRPLAGNRGARDGLGGTTLRMSADKDRGIRRQKQKRAKAAKKAERAARTAAAGSGRTETPARPAAA